MLFLFAAEMLLPLSREGMRTAPMGQLLSILVVLVAAFSVGLVGVKVISGWYRRRFGTVEPTRHQRRMGVLIGGGGVLLFLVPMNVEQKIGTLPVNAVLFTMALWMIGYWWYLGRSFWHYPVLGGIGIVLGLASIAGLPPATWAWHIREATLYIAAAGIIAGLVDHRILSSSLSHPGDRVGKES